MPADIVSPPAAAAPSTVNVNVTIGLDPAMEALLTALIGNPLATIIAQQEKIMTGLSDLTTVDTAIDAAVSALGASQTTLTTTVQTSVAAIQVLIAAAGEDGAVETISQDLNTQLGNISAALASNNAATAALTAAIPPVVAPAATAATAAIKAAAAKAPAAAAKSAPVGAGVVSPAKK